MVIYVDTDTQYAHFRGNPICQATKRHLTDKRLKTMKNEREKLILFWLSFCGLFSLIFVACSVLYFYSVAWPESFIFRLFLFPFKKLFYFSYSITPLLQALLHRYHWLFYVLTPPAHRTSAFYSPTLQHTDVTTLTMTTGRGGRRGPFEPRYSNQQPNNLSRSRIPCLNY